MAQAPIQLQRHERGSSAARRGSSTLQKIAQKKEQLKLYPRIKKLERIATHLACEVRESGHQLEWQVINQSCPCTGVSIVLLLFVQNDPSCQCQAWRPAVVPTSDNQALPTLLDSCRSCNHPLEAHVRTIKLLPEDQIDRILFIVYDMDNILLQMKNEREDQDLRKTYGFLFHFLKKNMLQAKLPSLAGEKLGTPPFEKPSIAKVRGVFVVMVSNSYYRLWEQLQFLKGAS